MLSLVSPQELGEAGPSRMKRVLPRSKIVSQTDLRVFCCHLGIHLPGAVPDPGVLGPRQTRALQLEPCLDQVQRMHDHHLETS